jgi:hypothetical protein
MHVSHISHTHSIQKDEDDPGERARLGLEGGDEEDEATGGLKGEDEEDEDMKKLKKRLAEVRGWVGGVPQQYWELQQVVRCVLRWPCCGLLNLVSWSVVLEVQDPTQMGNSMRLL